MKKLQRRLNLISDRVESIRHKDTRPHIPSKEEAWPCSRYYFIDSSQHFEKAKNQNYLRPGDIDKIIATYRKRVTEDKYSYAATLDEVRENDYNLNIPRYVDTFEEEIGDLKAVSDELKALDREMREVDEVIGGFCGELGIEGCF